jgi:uncharacterized protein
MKKKSAYVEQYKMSPHPEGGYYSQIYCSKTTVKINPEDPLSVRPTMTIIYYLLEHKSSFHRLKSDEAWHHLEGCDIKIHIIQENGILKTILLGKLSEDANPTVIVPANHWFAAEVVSKKEDDFAIVNCSVSPGFVYEDFELGQKDRLVLEYPHLSEIIQRLGHEEPKVDLTGEALSSHNHISMELSKSFR